MSLGAPKSEVDICNLALIHLKQSPVVQIDPPTTATERICAQLYHQVRRATLRSHPWNFALKRVALTPDVLNEPLFGYSHAYELPPDFVRYISRHDSQGVRVLDKDHYDLEGNHLLADGSDGVATYVKYIYDHQVVSKWDPLFISLFAINMAIAMAPNFQGSERRIDVLIAQREEIRTEATAIDGQERPPRRIERSRFVTARRSQPLVADSFTRFP